MSDIGYYFSTLIGPLFFYGPFVAAVLLGLTLPIIVIALSSTSAKFLDHQKLVVIFAGIVLGSTLATAFSGRLIISDAELASNPSLLATARQEGNAWFSRIAHLVVLAVSISEIFLWFLQKRRMGNLQFKLWLAAMAYYTFSIVVSGILGEFRGLDLKVLYMPIVLTAVALLAPSNYKQALNALRFILFIPLVGSLVAIWIAPTLVMETGYQSLIAGLSIRLAGLTEHANSLGVIAAIAIFLELSRYVRAKPNIFFLAIASLNLVLAQSKTAWGIAIICLALLGLGVASVGRNKRGSTVDLKLAVFVSFSVALAIAFVFFKIDALQNYLGDDRTGLSTFTGRTKIWSITWDEFVSNPLTGYGPALWDQTYRFQRGMMAVGQAHNQYMQTLGQAGILGIGSLAIYICLLLSRGVSNWAETGGLSLVLVLVVLIRGLSESPMRMLGIMDFDSFTHLLAFTTAAAVTCAARPKGTVLAGKALA